MKGLFNIDNPIMRFIVKFGYLWWLNILFIITSLPVFTIGASLTALTYATHKLILDEGSVTSNYFKSWKENFKQATALWMIYLVFGLLIIIALIFYNQIDTSELKLVWACVVAIAIVYFISLIWVFAIQSRFVNKVKDTIKFSLAIAFNNLPETFLIAITIICVIVLNLTTIFIVNFITVQFGIGWMAFMFSLIYDKTFDKYINKEENRKKRRDESPILR